jgi:hypothetical protein
LGFALAPEAHQAAKGQQNRSERREVDMRVHVRYDQTELYSSAGQRNITISSVAKRNLLMAPSSDVIHALWAKSAPAYSSGTQIPGIVIEPKYIN